MAFYPYSGKIKVEYWPKTASTALAANSVVATSSGQLIAATSSTTANIGVVLRAVTSASDDYAGTNTLPVVIPQEDTVFIALATTATTGQVGTVVDLTDAVTVGTGTSHKVVYVVGYLDSTHLLVKLMTPGNTTPS